MIEEHIERIFKVKKRVMQRTHCDSHCHHSEYWYQHAGYYYYEYREPRYENRASRTTVNTKIGVSTQVRLGLFLCNLNIEI
jgi:hypothetical protein